MHQGTFTKTTYCLRFKRIEHQGGLLTRRTPGKLSLFTGFVLLQISFLIPSLNAFFLDITNNRLWYVSGQPDQLVVNWNSPIHPNLQYGEALQRPLKPEGLNEGPISLELSEDSVTSDFSDFLDVRIGGLLPGQEVVVEKFKVTNVDSVIDAEAILQRRFMLQDGYSPGPAGVANLNIPNDFGDTPGEITFQLDFWEPDLANVCGHYFYRVSSPRGAFESVSTRFTVTETPTDSVFTGVVMDQGKPVPYALVGLLNPIGGYSDFVAGTTADEEGRYQLFAPYSDEFDLIAVCPGYVGKLGRGVSHFIDDDETLSVDLDLRRGSVPVSGRISDSLDSSMGVGGVELLLLSLDDADEVDGQAFSIVWTDADGRFSTSLGPGKWGILPRINSIYDRGYVNAADRPVKIFSLENAALDDLDVSITRGTSIITGTLTSETELNEQGEPLPLCGVEVMALNEDRTLAAWGVTDGDGFYSLAVTSGRWDVGPFTYSLWEILYGGRKEVPVLIPEANVAFQQDLTARPSAGDAFAFVTDENDEPIGKLRLYGINTAPARPEVEIQMTYDSDGLFCFSFPAGEWIIFPDPREAAKRQLLLRDLPKVRFETLDEGDEYPEIEFPVRAVTPESWIDVRLLSQDDKPVVGVGIHGVLTQDGHQYDSFAFSDSEGVAKIPAIPGRWELHASMTNLREAGFTALDTFFADVSGGESSLTKGLEPFTDSEPTLQLQQSPLDDALLVSGRGEVGMRYRVEASSDLSSWTELGAVVALDGTFKINQEHQSQAPRRFFRARPDRVERRPHRSDQR